MILYLPKSNDLALIRQLVFPLDIPHLIPQHQLQPVETPEDSIVCPHIFCDKPPDWFLQQHLRYKRRVFVKFEVKWIENLLMRSILWLAIE